MDKFLKIVNPKTNRQVYLGSKLGRSILQKYLDHQHETVGGAIEEPEEVRHRPSKNVDRRRPIHDRGMRSDIRDSARHTLPMSLRRWCGVAWAPAAPLDDQLR